MNKKNLFPNNLENLQLNLNKSTNKKNRLNIWTKVDKSNV